MTAVAEVVAKRQEPAPHGWPRFAAALLVAGTLPLLFVGGLVTTTGNGMAVPDWPSTFGHNMLLAPWRLWREGGVFVEHSHRLLGASVGLLTIHALVAALAKEPRRWVRGLSLAAFVGVVLQGFLGGQRVVLQDYGLALVHGCTAQLFFALAVALAVVTGRRWTDAPPASETPGARRARSLACGLAGLAYAQIVVGAVLRHQGRLLELHATLAVVVLAVAILAARAAKRTGRAELRRPAALVHAAIGLQLLLGVAAWLIRSARVDVDLKAAVVTFHVLGGAVALGATVALALATFRHVATPREVTA